MGDLSKVVPDNGGQLIVAEMVMVDLGSEVGLPPGREPVVEAISTTTASRGRSAASSSG